MSGEKEGWGKVRQSRKYHYFRDKRSLCGGWGYFGDIFLETGQNDHPENCKSCSRKIKKEATKISLEGL